ncbi:autotransporter-associated beta strand repeat-containing protein [Luteimonas sp. SX5]|uniref:Autotransporter-associated beta strand repeat-containing protein n=1 Tax=Luteimonas galliterrae TaxID=2940486 RepID=A0ABT0MLS8_9GAMM|nr:autotransporter-associated beta strand repeat-containing protein [Luteimonas galliterrae]MCL1635850.1 autotransporter-associated beta strand repeat-containing protein [Luteimonas galliterrae]
MNRIFRIIWSHAQSALIVVSELATKRSKRSGGAEVDERVAASLLMLDRDTTEGSPPATAWPLRVGIVLALLALCAPAQAADRWWDPNGTAIGLGGAGTWNTSNAFWSINNDGVSGPFSPWNNAALDDAFFAGTAGAVTLGGPITVHNITFQTNGYTITGGTLTFSGVDPTISVTTGAATISSLINGTSGLTKAGGGTLTLSNNNSFAGGVTVNGGTLSLSGNNSFGSAPTVISGGLNLLGTNSFVGDINVNGSLFASGAAALGDAGNNITISGGSLNIGTTGGSLAGRTVTLSGVGRVGIAGAGIGGAHFTGTGGLTVSAGVNLTDDTNNYTGSTAFNGAGGSTFTSIGNLGEASSLGAPTTVTDGTIGISNPSGTTGTRTVSYVGDGDVSNRNWILTANGYRGAGLTNSGTGTLTLTGAISVNRTALANTPSFTAQTADLELLGVISGNDVAFNANAGRVLRLGDANTFASGSIGGAGKVEAATLANVGVASSLGTGGGTNVSGTLSYVGAGASTNRSWGLSGTLSNDGTGMLTLSGGMGISGNATLGGSFTGADNVFSGVISGAGNLRSGGAGTWALTGANTYTGSTIVDSGVLRAGSAGAFGASTAFVVNGGTLDMNDFDKTLTTLSGSGGTVDLGSATLTMQGATGVTATYAGNIAGSGGLTKLGASTQTLTGASTYTGDTTIGGGVLNLDFSGAGGPASGIISSASTLNMSGGRINVTGAAGENNTQTFDGVFISAGNNTINATSGTGGSLTVNLGAITRTGGLMNFNLPGSGNITTTNTALGGWATVNGTDYAKVVGGNILAFTEADYTDKDNAANWLANEFITDVDGFFGAVNGSVQLGGLRYTAPTSTTVTVQAGETLGVDGTIIVAPSVANTNQVITGGMLTGAIGGTLGVQQNSTGNFTIASQIVDNGGSIGFTKAGTGLVTLANANNSYTGATQVVQGTLSVADIGNGGAASGIGASSADSANLLLEGATLRYTGTGDTSDRGFTFKKSGAITGSGIEVTNAGANLTFGGLVTSPDGANFTKSGAGTLTLANDANDFTGITTVSGGLLSVDTLANGGVVSGIGQSSSASANLVLAGGGLQYTGGTVSTDRGFTLGTGNGTVDVSNGATTLTVSGAVVGGGRLTKNGDGTLVLSGTNTYSGGNTVNRGILRAGSTQAFGAAGGPVNLANTAGVLLDLDGFNNAIGPLSGGGANGGNVTLDAATLTINGDGGNYSGVISGTGGITRAGGGTQTFNGCNNTYTGPTSLQGATVSVDCLANGGIASGIGASGSASTNLVLNSGGLNYTGGTITIDRGFQLAGGTSTIGVTNAATTLEFTGQVIGGGGLNKGGAGTLVLSGTNTSTGNTQISAGVLRAAITNAFGPQGHMTLNNAAGVLLDLDGFDTVVTSLNGGGANGGNISLGDAVLTLSNGGSTYAGAISGTGSLIKNGIGDQALTGCNSSYTGPTVINGGSLTVSCLTDGGVSSSIGASGSAPANLVVNGALRYVGDGDSTNRQFTLGTSGGTIESSGTGTIDFTYNGPVTLAGANTARTLTLTGTNTGDNVFSAQLDDNGTGATSLTKTGTGTWRLTNNDSTYTGVTRINGGVLSVDQMANGGLASSIGASSNAAANLVIGNGSTLRYTGAGDTTDRQFTLDTGVTFIESSGTGALQFTNTGAVSLTGTNTARTIALGGTNTGDNTLGGAIGDNGTGRTTLAKNDSGTWILTGNNTFTGNTVINNGNLMIGNGGTTGNAGAGNVIIDSATSTLSLNRSDTFTFGGTLSGPGTLAQIGSGTSVLASAGNSVGATTIGTGTLQVDGGLATSTVGMTGTSALTVNGTVQAPGNTQTALTGDAGEQTITVGAGGTLLASGDLGGGNDTVDLTGTLNTGAGALQLGDGDDTLVLNDGAQILGDGVGTSGGTGTDTLVVDTALGYMLDGSDIDTFDILTKQNSGELVLTGDHDFATGTNLNGGTLDVDGTLETPALVMADGTALNVDGTLEGAGSTPATITGSAGTNAITVGITGTLRANGDLGDGSDSVILAGTLSTGAGTLGLGAGDDVLTLQDGSFIEGGGVDAGAGSNDRLVLDNALAMVFDGGQTAGFETLLKQNTGTASMIGSQSFSGGTAIDGGTLDVDGTLQTPTVALADGTTLNVDGTVDGGAGTTAAIAGSAGDNMIAVGVGGTLLANGDLGTGNDLLDVAGTLDTGAGVFALGDGDDTLTIHENTNIIGTVSAGAGNDTFDTHIDTVADLGAVQGFETLSKTGTGVLNINGPMSSDFTAVEVSEGILNVTAAGDVVPAPGGTLDTTVASGAALNVDGSYGCGAGNDAMTVAGTVSGTGTIDLCGGDDTLTLQDGAVLDNAIGGGLGAGDTLVIDNAGAFAFDAGNTSGFELLRKDNAGTATLTGSQNFIGGTTIAGGTLDVDGTLETPTIVLADGTELNVDGTVHAAGPTPAMITGSTGVNTVTVGATGALLATGDLGTGNDTLDVIGTLNTGGGVFALGDGDDNFVVHDGSVVLGTVDGGAGLDTRTYDINTSADLGALMNFEGVTKTGAGVLNIAGPGATDLQEVEVLGGTLNIGAGGSVVATAGSTLDAVVAGGATLNVDGSFGCGAGNDSMTVSGTVSGSGTIDLCDGDDTLTLNDGAALATAVSGGAGSSDTVLLNNAGALAFDASSTTDFEILQKDNTGIAALTGTLSFVGGTTVNGGVLDVDGTLETPTVALADDAVLNVDGTVQAAGGTAAAITGSAGTNTISVTGTLLATGDLGDGNDVLDVAGTLDTMGGTFALGDGDDTLTIHDGTAIIGTVTAGAGNDTFNADIATSADLGAVQAFETLSKTGVGVLNVNGPTSSDFNTVNVLAGTLNVAAGGSVTAQTTTVAAGSTLLVGGSYSGTTGDDFLDVAGTLDMGGGAFLLGDGDDNFVVHDGTVVLGTVDGGAGLDTRAYDINTVADLGALANFEAVTKTGTGVLNINGPGATDLQEVSVLGGTLNVGPGGSVVATAGSALNTLVATGATLNVEGSYGCGDGNDTMAVSGTVSGSGTIDLCGGEDVLTLNDGAALNNVISGGGHGTGDTVVLNNADALSFDAGNTINFEFLQKDNTGEAILTGTQSFVGGATVNGGVLTVDGTLETPTVALADDTVLNIDGALQAIGGAATGISGSAGANTVTVSEGGTLLATGDLGDGNDVLDVAGTLDTAGGTFVLGDGDDTLTIHDNTNIVGTVVAGAGNDTFNADIATQADLGAVQDFETLSKTGVGVLNINGPMSSDFATVNVLGGALNVTAGGSVMAQTTTVAAGATLDVQGRFTGTEGNDRFTSTGTVRGALAFGGGDDSVDFLGGDLSGLAGLDGGAGGGDRLSFHGMSLDNDVLTPATGWERVDLLEGSELALNAPLNLSGGLLSIDATSELIASAGASLTGNLANSGLIAVGSARFGVNGNYTGGGALALTVSPAGLTSGGLDISGDVVGTTAIAFDSDGTQAPPQSASILVISSPNDDPATAGGFTPADSADGTVRLSGSVFPWSFGQQADGWYLNAETDVVLPEIGGYALLPSIGQAGILENNRLLSQRLSGIRGDQPRCDQNEDDTRAYWKLAGDCHGFWMAATASELEMGADPGFAFSGDSVGVYVGADVLLQDRETRTFRGGLYAGFQRGNYWATGANSTGLQGIGQANVRTDTPTFGMYGSVNWREGSYLDTTLVAQIPEATIAVAGGFKEEILGNSLTLSTQVGRRFRLDNGWTLEPQAQLSASAVHWQNKTDASGKQLAIDDGLLGKARVAVRAEKVFETEGGARIRPWATLGMQDTIGESENALVVASPGLGADAAAFPNHELGLTATLDLGVEAEFNESVSLFGVLSYDKSIEGTDAEQRQANMGVRIRW